MTVGDFRLTTLVATAGDEPAWRGIADCADRPDDDLGLLGGLCEAAYGWRSIDQDLASLSFDSSVQPVQVLRAEYGQARVLIFTATSLSLELELMADHVVGQIVPPGPGQIVVETPDGPAFQVEADDIGFFDFAGMPRGQVRLRCETPTGRLVTDWVCL